MKLVVDDEDIIELADQLREHSTTNIFVGFSRDKHDKSIPESILYDSKNDV